MCKAGMSGEKSLGGGDLAQRDALQITRSFRRHRQTFQPLLGDSVFNCPLVFQDF
ncbi:MAG: hypothetical protein P4M13_01735 [Alphaproteobacteria bacterium]|nr:hypothetical protein [Alphaproteobacteria bacterium]